MVAQYKLPARDELGFCNVLMSALGGDGANMTAKMLFKLGCTHFGLDGGYDAKYGSEKKGTATDVSVRFCLPGTPVRQAGPTETPHFLVVFREDLIGPLEMHRGLQPGAVCVVNSTRSPEEVRKTLRLHSGKVICVDATKIAAESHSRLNMPLLAALAHELAFPDEDVKEIVAKQWPRVAEQNLAAYDRALSEAQSATFEVDDAYELVPPRIVRGQIGWRNMLNGGTIDALTHTTAGRDNRIAAQGRVPKFAPEDCTSCGICLTVCSDPGGLLWEDGKMVGIDERFCKGCMRCIEVCPRAGDALALPEEVGEEVEA